MSGVLTARFQLRINVLSASQTLIGVPNLVEKRSRSGPSQPQVLGPSTIAKREVELLSATLS